MRTRRPALAALGLAALLSACAASGGGDAPAGGALAGTRWRLVTLLEEDLPTTEPEHAPLLAFEAEARATGSAGCNRFTGGYTHQGERLRLGPFAVTRRACAPTVMDLEERFLRVLPVVERYTIEGGFLELAGADGKRLARFVTADGG